MHVDLDNEVAVKYHEKALESFECVKDIFQIEVVQCVRPDTLLPELKDIPNQDYSSPMELAALHSHYKQIKKIASGYRCWVVEHDAYLRDEETFRMIMSKYYQMPVAQIGMANEFYTMWPEVAQKYIDMIMNRPRKGPMGMFHDAGDQFAREEGVSGNNIYWPARWKKNSEWVNKTGLAGSVTQAHNKPKKVINSPITQLIDERFGGTVQDRPRYIKNGVFQKQEVYTKQLHPDMHWITLDIDP